MNIHTDKADEQKDRNTETPGDRKTQRKIDRRKDRPTDGQID